MEVGKESNQEFKIIGNINANSIDVRGNWRANFSVAVSKGKDKAVEWFKCVHWGEETNAITNKLLAISRAEKGVQIEVLGYIVHKEIENEDGGNFKYTHFIVREIEQSVNFKFPKAEIELEGVASRGILRDLENGKEYCYFYIKTEDKNQEHYVLTKHEIHKENFKEIEKGVRVKLRAKLLGTGRIKIQKDSEFIVNGKDLSIKEDKKAQ